MGIAMDATPSAISAGNSSRFRLVFPFPSSSGHGIHQTQISFKRYLNVSACMSPPTSLSKSFNSINPRMTRRRLSPVASLPNLNSVGTTSMAGTFELVLKVRDYELDQYGVVNNAVYASYCQHSDYEICEAIGFNTEAIARTGNALALSELSLKYLAPLRSGDRFVIASRVSILSAARLLFEHFIYKLPNREPVLEAKSTAVFLDKSYRPVRVPSDFISKIILLRNNETK